VLQELKDVKQVLHSIEDGRQVVAALKLRPGAEERKPEDLYALQDDLLDLNDCLDDAANAVAKMQRRAGSARRGRDTDGMHNAQKSFEEARANVVAQSRNLSKERRRLASIATQHFPEMPLQDPEADLLGLGALEGVEKCVFEAFDEPSDILRGGNHPVHVTALQGNRCVLKEFRCSSRDLHNFQKEAKRMHALDHKSVVKLLSIVRSNKDDSKAP
jgi:hypothetical protein